ncbi:hypothetical protein DYBT9275_02407 [Dyadobacter sp. CECT 9275]|uniref:Uncharacterized protein n=2 Tax=Dyadobacter helix TaxID=2822344 RepID=A0A916JBJ5_9BACT|nr:hypothetical protein DYBT9275_02407 [Dyadobacter sp. CECT 9275]
MLVRNISRMTGIPATERVLHRYNIITAKKLPGKTGTILGYDGVQHVYAAPGMHSARHVLEKK